VGRRVHRRPLQARLTYHGPDRSGRARAIRALHVSDAHRARDLHPRFDGYPDELLRTNLRGPALNPRVFAVDDPGGEQAEVGAGLAAGEEEDTRQSQLCPPLWCCCGYLMDGWSVAARIGMRGDCAVGSIVGRVAPRAASPKLTVIRLRRVERRSAA
jgi:hypothetical protein